MSTQLFRARLSMAAYVALMFLWALATIPARAGDHRVAPPVTHDGRSRPLVVMVGDDDATERSGTAALAAGIGVDDGSTAHNSNALLPRFGVELMADLRTRNRNSRPNRNDRNGVPLIDGVDAIALAHTAAAHVRPSAFGGARGFDFPRSHR